jgi:enoyl-CoA hydratase/carnithine racemase
MIEFELNDGIARITIDRAEKKNAFTQQMWRTLAQHCENFQAAWLAKADHAPRAVILQGVPGAFCAGADIQELHAALQDPLAMASNHAAVLSAGLALTNLPMPTMAVIDGPCFGGGFALAAACDFRIGSTRCSFAITPARLGLLYGLEDTRLVVRLIGDAKARRMLMRSERIGAAKAFDWGILDTLVEPGALADLSAQRAQEMARSSRTSMAGIKATLGLLSNLSPTTAAQLHADFESAFRGPDFAEGAKAFLERREPQF